jgi:inner membrane protein
VDSLTQLALGAAVGVAVMGRHTAVWKAALWGGLCGTLPDLDAFIDHGDPIRNMTLHRAESHALFWLTLASPLLAWLPARLHGELPQWRRWWLAVWLALVTHPLLDLMTVYGTQLLLPFTDRPFGVGSIFIIDPLYTLPLIVGVLAALAPRNARGTRWNAAGLALSSAYLAWSVAAQQHVAGIAMASLQAQGQAVQRLLVTPAPFNTVLWRIVAITPTGFAEGFHSLLDRDRRVTFDHFPRGESLYEELRGDWHTERIAWFSRGFFKMSEHNGELRVTDLRMGQEPYYVFSFTVARRQSPQAAPVAPQQVGARLDLQRGMPWLWRRTLGEPVPAPR